ncbi:MAG: response regulator [Pseudobutyrivibrio sp.]|nr:response regulator [Pseudobutyrivibrio sp.]
MRKVLIVGEFNDETSALNTTLSQFFTTQLCTQNAKIIKSMLKMYGPDIVLMGINELEGYHSEIYDEFVAFNPHLPIITFGTEVKRQQFISYYRSGQCKNVNAPYSIEDILNAICKELGICDEILRARTLNDNKKHILVVDDNPVLLRNMRNMLSDKYRVSMATSAAQCMKVLGSDAPDMIILDYEMPVVDGKQTLEMIRAEEDYKNIPVIFLTGIADKAHVDAVLDLKPAGYFVKPPMQTKIINAIEGILNKE